MYLVIVLQAVVTNSLTGCYSMGMVRQAVENPHTYERASSSSSS